MGRRIAGRGGRRRVLAHHAVAVRTEHHRGHGGGSEISIALGKEDRERAAKTAANVFVMFWSFALLCTLLGLLFLESLLALIGAGGELLPYAKEYSVIMLAGAVTSTGFSSLIRAEGATKYALLIWVIPISVNMALDPVFIFALDMGVTAPRSVRSPRRCYPSE